MKSGYRGRKAELQFFKHFLIKNKTKQNIEMYFKYVTEKHWVVFLWLFPGPDEYLFPTCWNNRYCSGYPIWFESWHLFLSSMMFNLVFYFTYRTYRDLFKRTLNKKQCHLVFAWKRHTACHIHTDMHRAKQSFLHTYASHCTTTWLQKKVKYNLNANWEF